MKVILQTNQSDCLLACAAMIMETYGCKIPIYRLVEKVELSTAGSNVLQLKEALGEYGFDVQGYRIEKIEQTMLPAIVYVNKCHFIVVSKIRKNRVIAIDPAIGRIAYSLSEFKEIYSGVIIKLSCIERTKYKGNRGLGLLDFWRNKSLMKIMIGLLVSSVFTQFVAMSYSYMYSALEKSETYHRLITILSLAVVMLGIGSIIQGILTKQFNILYEQIYGNRLVDRLVSKNYKFFTFRSNGDLLYRINARGVIKDTLLLKMVPSTISLCTIILVQGLLFYKNFFVGMIFLIITLIYLLVYIFISKSIYTSSNKYTQKVIKLNTTSENIVRTISTIKVLDVESVFMKKWHMENEMQAQQYGQLVVLQSFQNVLTNIFTYIVPIGISIVGIICNSDESVLSQIALLPLLYLVVQNTAIIGQAFNSLYTVLPNIDKANEILDEEFMRERKRNLVELGDCQILVKNMYYYYGNQLCLENVNLNIQKGKKYAVIGISGSGKSTLLKILSNLLNDYHGSVLFDQNNADKPIYMDQDTSIIDSTIMENVLFGQNCSSERLMKISNAVGLTDIIMKQPQQWQTEISKGKNLSRGQEQRICLARCLLKESDVYLLDEATSNIDVIDEEKIVNNLVGENGILNDKTVFISTHKLSMVGLVDEVIYIKNGCVYQGKHEWLIERFPEYRDMY